MEKAANPYRFERKFTVDQLSLSQAQAIIRLHPAMFLQPYPPRYINNIYFDTHDLKCCTTAIDGADHRVKIRIRWHHDLFGRVEKPALELKIKKGLVGTKQSFPLAPFDFTPHLDRGELARLFDIAALPDNLSRQLMHLTPSLVNRYYRQYYATPDKRFRITIDHQMESWSILAAQHLTRRHLNRHLIVLELKYDPEHDIDARRITDRFPFRLSRHSKYIRGLELTTTG